MTVLNNLSNQTECHLCGRWGGENGEYLETHHMLHGYRMKQKADDYGLTCGLCHRCHRLLHDKNLHDLELQQEAQRMFEEKYSHELFMQEFGKNFLTEEEE